MPPRGRLPSLHTAVATALLLAGVAFAPGRAVAGCGDYVRIAGQPMTGHDAPDHADPATPLPTKPCHGPGCSGHPATPVVPVTAPGTGGPQEWAARLADALSPAATGRRLPPHTSDTGTVSRPGSVFHPPRGR